MPWKECHVVDERLRFVARLLDGEKMTTVCAEFGISRETGYKIYDRYKDYGVHGLTDRSRRPYRYANQLPLVIETQIVRLKRDYPDWILGTSTTRPVVSSPSRARSAQPCYRCVRNNPSPMSLEWTLGKWSGRLDSNQRPPAPKAGALPGCATPRPVGHYRTRRHDASVRREARPRVQYRENERGAHAPNCIQSKTRLPATAIEPITAGTSHQG